MREETPHILAVDDDARLRNLLRRFLMENGFRVSVAADAAAARAHLQNLVFDLIVLDVMMPGENGVELTRSLRVESQVPILLLTAMGEGSDRIAGLESGADDYLTKPFEPRELVLRIRTILRRSTQPLPPAPEPMPAGEITFGEFRFDPVRNMLWRGEEPVRLTESEGALLAVFAASPGTVFSREDLAEGEGAATESSGNARTIDVQITRLRRKIEPDPKFPRFLQTVRGRGYVLRPDS
ncbi:response regulator [Thalassobaculum litoreum]|uniref:Two-component system, OmpR family, phosphate regulon response regulator OmpR n=1 Tax=Thalassobaculum litoreum DSM 18839 TaxID=1123362 RepID=A0A8G2BI87_9PROT|nr:response regulator transcription factor [Thalassobaculum litoreum]SDF85857.1 two-component system, OmpR family, phosphate regulon response regulator OmpR [Thalassobaculum litoreum DSM 18839]